MKIAERKADEKIVLDGSSPIFEGTVYQGQDFKIIQRRLTKAEAGKLSRLHTRVIQGQPVTDDESLTLDILESSVESFDKIENERGDPLPADESGFKWLIANASFLVLCMVRVASQDRLVPDVPEQEVKNSGSTQGGDST